MVSSRRSRIFLKRGPLSCEVPSRRDSVGGGSSRIFCGLQKPSRFSGGGVVAEFFRGLQTPSRFSGGGVVAHFPIMGPFYIFRLFQRWGGRAPAPPESATGLLLIQTCNAHELVITNALFRLPTRNKTTWMHLRSKHWHLIDYVITRKKDESDVSVTKSMCGADCWTEHRLLVSKLTLRI